MYIFSLNKCSLLIEILMLGKMKQKLRAVKLDLFWFHTKKSLQMSLMSLTFHTNQCV